MEKTINECFFQIQNGANIKQGDVEGGFPITRIETTANDKFNRDRMGYAGITDISKYEAYVLEDGDLLMSHINSVQYLGRTVLYVKQPDETIIHGMNLLRLKARRNIINPAYARYCFYGHTFRCQIGNITKKSVNQASFAVKDLKQIKIEVPSLDVQNKVVVILDRVQKLIDMRNNELASLDDLIKARFVEMFGDPIINSFGIDTKSMTDVCEIIDGDRGKNYPTADEFSDEGYCLFLNAKNVTSTGFNFATCMFVTKEKDEVLRKGKLSRGDVVLTTRGTLGNLAFYTEDIPFEHVRINSGMVILRMKQDVVDEVYFIEQFKMQLADIREKIASGSAQPQLPISAMNKINILTPNIEKQRQFADFVRKVDKSKVIEIIK